MVVHNLSWNQLSLDIIQVNEIIYIYITYPYA